MPITKKCYTCTYKKWSGFERTLITRGKNRGQYRVVNFIACGNPDKICDYKKEACNGD